MRRKMIPTSMKRKDGMKTLLRHTYAIGVRRMSEITVMQNFNSILLNYVL